MEIGGICSRKTPILELASSCYRGCSAAVSVKKVFYHKKKISISRRTKIFGVGVTSKDLAVDVFLDTTEEQLLVNIFAQNLQALSKPSQQKVANPLSKMLSFFSMTDETKTSTAEAVEFARDYLAKIREDQNFYSKATQEEMAERRNSWKPLVIAQYDTNQSGVLEEEEIKIARRERESWFRLEQEMDLTNLEKSDGSIISPEKFHEQRNRRQNRYQEAFADLSLEFELNGSNSGTDRKLKEAAKKLRDSRTDLVENFMVEFDKNADGNLDHEEKLAGYRIFEKHLRDEELYHTSRFDLNGDSELSDEERKEKIRFRKEQKATAKENQFATIRMTRPKIINNSKKRVFDFRDKKKSNYSYTLWR